MSAFARFRGALHDAPALQFMLALVVLCGITFGAAPAYAKKVHKIPTTPVVVTPSGQLRGVINGDIDEYLGIPYAAPPVGNLRWMPPQPYGRWQGVLDASAFGSQCTQPGGVGSENCLFLNIYVPIKKNDSKKHLRDARDVLDSWRRPDRRRRLRLRPHSAGRAGRRRRHDQLPPRLPGIHSRRARSTAKGMRPGTTAYRISNSRCVGCVTTSWPSAATPSNVTIFGESAGGHSVYCQLASPTAAGLFEKAISESGSYVIFDSFLDAIVTAVRGRDQRQRFRPSGASIADSVGCTDQTAACLRAVSNTELINVEPGTLYALVDGTLLTETPEQAFAAGTFNQVPVIAGTNHDEWRAFVAEEYDFVGNPILTEAEYDDATIALWTSLLGPIVEIFYPYSAYPSGGVALGASGTDGIFACGARTADQLLAQFTTTYTYEFNDENAPPPQSDIPGLTFPLGAYHGSEIQYLFDFGLLLPA